MIIIFSGTIGCSGTGGQAWASLQYLLGLRALGHEVYYLEDCGETSSVYDWEKEEMTQELDYPARFLKECLDPFGFAGRWIYRTTEESAGMQLKEFQDICGTADLLILRCVPFWVWREEYDGPRRRAFIDVDPGFTQVNVANGCTALAEGIARCERRFTISQRIGAADCLIQTAGGPWLPSRSPVALEHWPYAGDEATDFTSAIRWKGIEVFKEDTAKSELYGQRDREFPKYLSLPTIVQQPFRLALLGADTEPLIRNGWAIEPGELATRTPFSYRNFIQNSRAEFCVPKHGYIATRGGWFSDRSVCYLASGRPVLIGETGVSNWLPTGEGLLTFRDLKEAVAGVEKINSDYNRHRLTARKLAEEFFSAEKVLPELLDAAMN